jgi:hypothetical protein
LRCREVIPVVHRQQLAEAGYVEVSFEQRLRYSKATSASGTALLGYPNPRIIAKHDLQAPVSWAIRLATKPPAAVGVPFISATPTARQQRGRRPPRIDQLGG